MSERPARGILALLLVLTATLYAPTLGYPFVFDDLPLVVNNALLRTRAGLATLMLEPTLSSDPSFAGHWRPVLMLTMWLNYQLAGPSPSAFRAVNLLLHLGNGLLAYALVRRWLAASAGLERARAAALFAAGVLLLHPLSGITVHLVLKRNTLLATGFSLGSLLLFARSLAAQARARRWLFAGSLALSTCALLSKEDGVVMPALVLLLGHALGAPLRRSLPWALPSALLGALFVGLRFPRQVLAHGTSAPAYALSQPLALLEYLRMLVQPERIAVAYELDARASPLPWGRVALLLALLTSLAFAWRARREAWGTAVLWAAVWLGPSSSVFPLLLTVDEVRAYPAFILGYGVLGLGVERLCRALSGRVAGQRIAPLVTGAVPLVLATAAAAANLEVGARYADDRTAFAYAVQRYPSSALGNTSYCVTLQRLGPSDTALRVCRRAIELDRGSPYVRCALTLMLAQRDELESARRSWREAVDEQGPSDVLLQCGGQLAMMRGELAGARGLFEQLVARRPLDDAARVFLALVLAQLGEREAAQRVVRTFDGAPPAAAQHRELLREAAQILSEERGRPGTAQP